MRSEEETKPDCFAWTANPGAPKGPLKRSDADYSPRNGISHLQRDLHICLLCCNVFIRRVDRNRVRNDPSVHCHGNVIPIRFSHIYSKNPPALRILKSNRTVVPSVPDARAILGESNVKPTFLRNTSFIPYFFCRDTVAFAYGEKTAGASGRCRWRTDTGRRKLL